MSGVFITRPGDRLNNSGATTRAAIGIFQAGDTLRLVERYGEFFNNGTTNPANLANEGPYLRIVPTTGFMPEDDGVRPSDLRQWEAGQTVGVKKTPLGPPTTVGPVSPAIGPGNGVGTDNNDGVYYQIDARTSSAIVFPFTATAELVTDQAGVFLYDLLIDRNAIPKERAVRMASQIEYCQTRVIAEDTTRVFYVPAGCSAWAHTAGRIDNAAGQPAIGVADIVTGVADAPSAFRLPATLNDATVFQNPRMSLAGMRVLRVTAPATHGNCAIAFWVRLG